MWRTLSFWVISTISTIYACVPTTSPDTLPDIPGVFTTTTTAGSSLTSTTTDTSSSLTSTGSTVSTTATSMTTTTTVTPACLAGWVYYPASDFCYFYGADFMYTFTQARQYCATRGGELASIHNQAEQDFITSLTPPAPLGPGPMDFNGKRVAIGPYRIGPGMDDTNFANFDGTPFDYSNWANMRPDNGGANMNQNCVFMATDELMGMVPRGQWNDFTCFSVVDGFICQAARV